MTLGGPKRSPLCSPGPAATISLERPSEGERKRDYAHFLSIARGSLYETMTQLEMAKEFGYLESIDETEILAAEISRMLTTLMKKYIPLSNSNS